MTVFFHSSIAVCFAIT